MTDDAGGAGLAADRRLLPGVHAREVDYDAMVAEWAALISDTSSMTRWETAYDEAVAAEAALRAAGHWRSGGRTLLHSLGLHHSELHLCAGLAWLLTPDGWHGLGPAFLRAFLNELDLSDVDPRDAERALVVTEETISDTRADLVIRLPVSSRTVLVEAKVWAGEQDDQCDRLAQHWESESPVLVFLTRTGVAPATALRSHTRWRTLTWSRVAALLDEVTRARDGWAPGVAEYLSTLEIYGGRPHG
jgi:hypothetical protein